jgi:hypothetical protein
MRAIRKALDGHVPFVGYVARNPGRRVPYCYVPVMSRISCEGGGAGAASPSIPIMFRFELATPAA